MELDPNNAAMLVELITKRCSAPAKDASVDVDRKLSPCALVEMSRRDQTETRASKKISYLVMQRWFES